MYINAEEMEIVKRVTATKQEDQLDQDANRAEALQKGYSSSEGPKRVKAKSILRKLQAALGCTSVTNEERKVYQRKAWNMAAKYNSSAMFLTVTPHKTGNATVAAFSGDISNKSLAQMYLIDIP